MPDESSTALPISFTSDSDIDVESDCGMLEDKAGESETDKVSLLAGSTLKTSESVNDKVSLFAGSIPSEGESAMLKVSLFPVVKLSAGASVNEGVSVKALTKDITLERLSVIPTVSDCEELNANAASSEIDKVSVLEVENESAGESVSEMLNAFALSPTKKRFLLSGSSLTSASTRLTNCKEVCRSMKSKSVEVLADKFRDAIC